MRLEIKNFAKIKEADIIIDGITVIAGENNTGKSTIGKILFALFNSLSNVEDKIFEERLKEIERKNRRIILNNFSDVFESRGISSRFVVDFSRNISRHIWRELKSDEDITDDNFQTLVENTIKSWWPVTILEDNYNELIISTTEQICSNTKEILNLQEEPIILEIVSRFFDSIFHSQIESLVSKKGFGPEVILNIKEKDVRLFFKNSYCYKIEDNVKIMNKAVYIDNPFVIDKMSGIKYRATNLMNGLLLDLLTSEPQEGVIDGVIESVRTKEKLNDIYKTFHGVVDGEISLNQSDKEYYLKSNEFDAPISLHNLSTGMKSFVILKMLLEKGRLEDKDVVILDEPEIHLHPQWQVVYAELIVLLQKHFDLSVVVTTHSPYFVDALNLFSKKYEVDEKINYYLATNNKNAATMKCVNDEIDQIYEKMVTPIDLLDTLRYGFDNN